MGIWFYREGVLVMGLFCRSKGFAADRLTAVGARLIVLVLFSLYASRVTLQPCSIHLLNVFFFCHMLWF